VRRPDPDDGRATRIALTKRGHTLAEKAMTEHSARAGAISDRLTTQEQEQLAGLLRKLLQSFEVPSNARPAKRDDASEGLSVELAQS
jgi:DNA-binding MarR family transcriptional regulator